MANVVKGRIYRIGNVEVINTKGGSTLEKQELILDASRYDGLTGEKIYENLVAIEFMQKNIAKLEGFKQGDMVEVSFELVGNKYQTQQGDVKYITRARGFNVEQLRKKAETEAVKNIDDMPF